MNYFSRLYLVNVNDSSRFKFSSYVCEYVTEIIVIIIKKKKKVAEALKTLINCN